jgi:D-alanyl-D-alanine carboxypeptidase
LRNHLILASRSRRGRRGALPLLAALTLLAVLPVKSELASADPPAALACNDQGRLPFLIRGNYLDSGATTPSEKAARAALHERAIRYRTVQYGYVEGFGSEDDNPHPAAYYAEPTTFMGLRVTVNRRILPALRCVEQEIRATCSEPYRPQYLSGLRTTNTFHNNEVSNHLYGIAVDVDPEHNFCCGCVGPAAAHPACKDKTASLRDRMAMPDCWVSAFERFGFYWLGRDAMEDTMHFEFLGDPGRIVRKGAPGAGGAPGR